MLSLVGMKMDSLPFGLGGVLRLEVRSLLRIFAFQFEWWGPSFVPCPAAPATRSRKNVIMKIESLLSEKYIALNLVLETKEQVIEKMLSIVLEHPGVRDIDRLRADVLKREQEMSTGIGKKIALPHAKTGAVTHPVLAIATLKEDINFDAIDGEPVEIIFLLATPEDMLAEHLKLLGRITRLAGRADVREKICRAESSTEVLEMFREEEKDLPQI